ncbi:MAG: RHS repeat-associated core domain-containing protein [Thermodesulfobacteriota bacterium]|nr:RHS repeat-associated core domain-containing protein [Thermodesulfobacteriota bacterium]
MPAQITVDANTVDFVYDGSGVRAKKTVNQTNATYYIGKYYEKRNGVITKYIFSGNTRIAKIKGTDVYYFHKDHLGSSTLLTNASGTVVETTEYMPFGGDKTHSGALEANYKYTDHEYDVETGLYNYRARLYDPIIATFITPDSIVPHPSDPQMLNRYAYCRNNPIKYVDPSGNYPYTYDDVMAMFFPGSSDPYSLGSSYTSTGMGFDGRIDPDLGAFDPDYVLIADDGSDSNNYGFINDDPIGRSGFLYPLDPNGGPPFPVNDWEPNYGHISLGESEGLRISSLEGDAPDSTDDAEGVSGLAVDFGGGYGSGWGNEDNSDGGSAGTGVFCGVRPNSGGHAQVGAFFHQSIPDEVSGGRFGAGINITAYKGDASNFFNGEMDYTTKTIPLGSLTEHFDPTTGDTTGWTVGLGRGVGVATESGTSSSWATFLQK